MGDVDSFPLAVDKNPRLGVAVATGERVKLCVSRFAHVRAALGDCLFPVLPLGYPRAPRRVIDADLISPGSYRAR